MCVGVPGQIVSVTDEENCLGIVQIGGVRREINIACIVEDSKPAHSCVGEWVLVHVGFAMSRIDAAQARVTLALLHELGEAAAELEAMQQSSEVAL